jgi:hypothetical protein
MRLIFTPEDGEKREWEFTPLRLMSFQTDWLEEAGGETWASYDEWARLFGRGNRKAQRAALWVMLRAEQPDLKWRHLVIRNDELDVVWESQDMAAIRERILADPSLGDDERTDLLAGMDVRDEGPKDIPAGSGPEQEASEPSEPSTDST